jgi:hypothetical protein
MTRREVLVAMGNVAEVKNNADFIGYINAEIEKLDNKKPSKKATEKAEANDLIKNIIVSFLESNPDNQYTITDMQTASPDLADYSNQKLSALIKQLVDSGKIDKVVDKRKSYFKAMSVAETTDVDANDEVTE